jgi:hypothetical protein
MGTTIILSVITSFMLFLLTHFSFTITRNESNIFNVPNFYKLVS